ncbi:protein arginine kinase [Alkalihalobacillus macyae]|uniref:protein arginine kinase n=1 Tax=Guptibacillus hwajinpoensis TaxID=208199 RepID=UPI00273AE45F|nr:protein arginine kinase [Alkalihalobacillus macyae]MDP4553341.1 protein arginine kinase [Alkalihalobacillus macyae]
MSLQRFISEAVSPWMKDEGPDSDIVMSSRVRFARNLKNYVFPILSDREQNLEVIKEVRSEFNDVPDAHIGELELLEMEDLKPIEKRVLVEKHLISRNLIEQSKNGAVLLSENETVSIMVNEEDHFRIQCLVAGFELKKAFNLANSLDDWIESKVDYAFDERRGYLTSCPTNVGTGMRASVMLHLPALVLTQQLNHIIPAINQLGLVVRGSYGEGSEALGNIFQISNQITLGKTETDIIEDLQGVVMQVIEKERAARRALLDNSRIELEDRVYRSLGILENSRIIQSKEAAKCLSDVRLGIDLGLVKGLSKSILTELLILTQPGFLQQFAGASLTPTERDIKRATLIRERLELEYQLSKKSEGDEQ